MIEELHTLLLKPYDEESSELEAKWYQKTPAWAQSKCIEADICPKNTRNYFKMPFSCLDMPGASFMS